MINAHLSRVSATDYSGFTEQSLDKLVVEVYDYASNVKSILNKIEEIMTDSSSYFDCDVAVEVRNKFKVISERFYLVSDNIISYAEDLVQVKSAFYKISNQLSDTAENARQEFLRNNISETYHEKR